MIIKNHHHHNHLHRYGHTDLLNRRGRDRGIIITTTSLIMIITNANIIIITTTTTVSKITSAIIIALIIRYGHTCLLTEVAGTRGIMVAGGALAGKQVEMMKLMMMSMMMMNMVMVVGGAFALQAGFDDDDAGKQVVMIMGQRPCLSPFSRFRSFYISQICVSKSENVFPSGGFS